ncbi:hypothetical protein, partial [Helicobacter sp. 11S02629-2]|uniref:hypothetical protein n=1 Tax=Helicobacter sp. 11S02629-2 TaxID=1476195 RepID=UPI000BA697CA
MESFVSTKELAFFLDITDRHVYNLEKAGVLQKLEKDVWDLKSNFKAYLYYKIENETNVSDYGKVKIRRELADARLKELQYKEKLGKLIDVEEIAKILEDTSSVVSNKLYTLSHMLKRDEGIDERLVNIIDNFMDAVLKELKDPKEYEIKAAQAN